MKKILIISILLISFIRCNAQSSSPHDMVEAEKIKINNKVKLDDSTSVVISFFGQPNSIKPVYHELQDKTLTVYMYSGLELSFLEDNPFDFTITGMLYSLYMDGFEIKIGAAINSLQSKFSKSCNRRNSNGVGIIIKNRDEYI